MSSLFRRTAGPPLRYAQRIVGAMVRPVQLRRHASQNKELNVCIGCGWDVREGWLNTDYGPNRLDVIFLDACKPMPFADGTVDRYYAEHMIEHIPAPEAEKMLRECLRTLKPGGRIRLVTPDLRQLMRLLTDPDDPVVQKYSAGVANVCDQPRFKSAVTNTVRTFNIAVRDWGHEFMYDFPSLKALLEAVGFSDVQRFKVHESTDPGLKASSVTSRASATSSTASRAWQSRRSGPLRRSRIAWRACDRKRSNARIFQHLFNGY